MRKIIIVDYSLEIEITIYIDVYSIVWSNLIPYFWKINKLQTL